MATESAEIIKLQKTIETYSALKKLTFPAPVRIFCAARVGWNFWSERAAIRTVEKVFRRMKIASRWQNFLLEILTRILLRFAFLASNRQHDPYLDLWEFPDWAYQFFQAQYCPFFFLVHRFSRSPIFWRGVEAELGSFGCWISLNYSNLVEPGRVFIFSKIWSSKIRISNVSSILRILKLLLRNQFFLFSGSGVSRVFWEADTERQTLTYHKRYNYWIWQETVFN